jgi:hypothetical protein
MAQINKLGLSMLVVNLDERIKTPVISYFIWHIIISAFVSKKSTIKQKQLIASCNHTQQIEIRVTIPFTILEAVIKITE